MTRAQLTAALLLITIICLGLAALLLPATAASTTRPEPLLPVPASEVTGLEVRLADGRAQTLHRAGPDRWLLSLPAQQSQVQWPASTERARAFLRILDRLKGSPAPNAHANPATTLTITSHSRVAATIGLPANSLGGRALVQIARGPDTQPTAFITTDELSRLFSSSGMLHWIDDRAFPSVTGQVTAITVSSAAGAMTITRTGADWRITSPFDAPAETALVAELADNLQSLGISGPSTEPAVPAPDATTITLSTITRAAETDGSIATSAARHTLTTLGPVAQSGQVPVLLVSTDGSGSALAGPLTAAADAARLTEIVRRPEFYIARRATAAQPADIRSITIERPGTPPIQLTRTDAGWSRDDAPLADPHAAESLVALLTQTNAVAARPAHDARDGAQHLATITAHGLGGLPLLTAALAVGPPPAGSTDSRDHAILTADGITRFYSPEASIGAVTFVVNAPE